MGSLKFHYRSKLDNVSSRDFLCFILNVLLCICNCNLKDFSELEVTDTCNGIFRILVPFQGRPLIIFTVSFCEMVFLPVILQIIYFINLMHSLCKNI